MGIRQIVIVIFTLVATSIYAQDWGLGTPRLIVAEFQNTDPHVHVITTPRRIIFPKNWLTQDGASTHIHVSTKPNQGLSLHDLILGTPTVNYIPKWDGTDWTWAEDATGAGGGDPVLVNTVAITDANGVDLTSGDVTVTLNAGVSPDTATFGIATDAVDDTHIDWGIGAGQVSADDIGDGSANAIITLTQETNFETAYTHSQDNTQAHSDYLLNSESDTMTGTLTADGFTLGNDELITFGTKTLKFESTRSDFILGDDLIVEDIHPGIYIRSTDDNRAYGWHYHPNTEYPLGLWRGQDTGSGIAVNPNKPLLGFDDNNDAWFYNGSLILPASEYLNFGTIQGTNGYGFQDSAGTMQFKNSGGSWTNLGSGGPSYWEWTLLPSSAILDDNNPPAITVIESTGTGTARFRVADFDATTDEIIYWQFVVPSDMAAGNWLADVSWYANDVGPNETCVWEIFISATTEADADTMAEQAVGTTNYASEDCNETEANRLMSTTVTLSNLDSVAAGDTVVLRFSRDADSTNATDDLSSDARLFSVRLQIPRS